MTLPVHSLSSPYAPIRVMVVDDSAIIRGLVVKALEKDAEITIVSTSFNGKMAIENLKKSPADIILLDIEMPDMDGLTALPHLLKLSPTTRIIMVSSLTVRNAEASIKAMQLGASDYITKPHSKEDNSDIDRFYREINQKIKSIAPRKMAKEDVNKPAFVATPPVILPPKTEKIYSVKYPTYPVKAIAIGSSTGGPQALEVLFKNLAGFAKNIHQPVFITQHMPATFTTILAKHIEQISGKSCAEAKDGDVVSAGKIYIAPGDFHMIPEKSGDKIILRLNQNPPVNFCRPAVDPMLDALTSVYNSHLLTVILTGMGSDGFNGSKTVVKSGGTVVAQNEASCVVWGMPRAVTEGNLCSAVLPLEDIANYIIKACV